MFGKIALTSATMLIGASMLVPSLSFAWDGNGNVGCNHSCANGQCLNCGCPHCGSGPCVPNCPCCNGRCN